MRSRRDDIHTLPAAFLLQRYSYGFWWQNVEQCREIRVYRYAGCGYLTAACESVGHVTGLTDNFENCDNGGWTDGRRDR